MSDRGDRPWRPRPSLGAVLVTLLLAALVVLDLAAAAIRRWFVDHALTTAALTGVLVLLITTLVVDRVVHRRQVHDRARVIAAQAAILSRQGMRATEALRSASSDEEREAANEELRTYLTMLLTCAPVLIDAEPGRMFLERAQHLAAELARARSAGEGARAVFERRVDDALIGAREAAQSLISVLDTEERAVVTDAGDSAGSEDSGAG